MKKYVITDFGVKPDLSELQTDAMQAVLDKCRDSGGTVVIPKGRYRVGGLYMYSDTTLYLESGACLIGSDVCEDYKIFPVPEGVEMRSDMEMIKDYYGTPWDAYRRAIITVYGGRNVSIIGESGSVIDGSDCCDPKGEEGYRGPHGIFVTSVENLTFKGYTIQNCGNFMHEANNCKNIVMQNVTCLGGSDGIHAHFSENILIEDCVFHTGDDCIAGINMTGLTVRRCDINTSCHAFRSGGSHILVEDCKIWGDGIYPHGMTVVQNRGTDLVRLKSSRLPREAGRHNLIAVYHHFGSTSYPMDKPYTDVVFRNCDVKNAGRFLCYASKWGLQAGATLGDITLENVRFTELLEPSAPDAPEGSPLTVKLINTTAEFSEKATVKELFADCKNTKIFENGALKQSY